jgi:hypothetical protein
MGRNKPGIYVYEEYKDTKEKRQAQKGASRGVPTGKARGYAFVFACNGMYGNMMWEGMAPVFYLLPGSTDTSSMASTGMSWGYLRSQCRRIGKKYLTGNWKKFLKSLE